MGGGSRLLNASTSRAGRNERESSEVFLGPVGEKGAVRRNGEASIVADAVWRVFGYESRVDCGGKNVYGNHIIIFVTSNHSSYQLSIVCFTSNFELGYYQQYRYSS